MTTSSGTFSLEIPDLGDPTVRRLIEKAERVLGRAALDRPHAAVARRARLAQRLHAKAAPSDAKIGVTAAKWGGAPDLPAHVEVPPLALLCQINLARLPAAFLAANGMPTGGILSFFFDLEKEPVRTRPEELGARVIHTPSRDTFVRREPGQATMLPACELRHVYEITLPAVASSDYGMDDSKAPEAGQGYSKAREAVEGLVESESLHRFLGDATPVQGDMQLACTVSAMGRDPDQAAAYEGLSRDVRAGARRWRLLLQVDSSDTLEWIWGDAGRLYFWIHDDDLRVHRFDRVRTVLQAH